MLLPLFAMRSLPEHSSLHVNYCDKKIMWVQEHGQVCVTTDGACFAPRGRSPPYTQPPVPHAPGPLVLPALRPGASKRPYAYDHPPGQAAARLTRDPPGGSATRLCSLSSRTASQLTPAVRCEEQPEDGPAPRTGPG